MAVSVTAVLRNNDIFARLPEAELRKIARWLKERHLHQHQVLFRQGDPSDALYVVLSGRLRVSAAAQGGPEKVLAFVGPGEVIGEMGVLSGEPRSATAVASADTKLLQLRKSEFDAILADNFELMRDLARVVGRRREVAHQRAVDERHGGAGGVAGLVTVLFSPRGGAGTTTIATNLAVALTQRKPDQVLLLDLNLRFSHVPLLLNITPRTSVAGISPVALRQMDRESFEFYLTAHPESSLRVLTAVLQPEDGETLTGEHVTATLELARRHFAHVIVDLGRSFAEVNLTAIEAAHNLVVVCTPERAGVRGVSESQRIFRDVVHMPGGAPQYVLNHASPYAAISPKQVEDALQMTLVGTIPFGGDAVARAALEGRPLVTRWPNAPTSKALLSLSGRLEAQLAETRAFAAVAS